MIATTNPADPAAPISCAAESPWVLFVSDIPLAPDHHGCRVRARTMVQALREAGYKVGYVLWERYWCCDPEQVAAMKRLVDDLIVVPVLPHRPGPPPSTPSLLGRFRRRIVHFPRVLRPLHWLLERLPLEPFRAPVPQDWCPAEVHDALDLLLRSRPVTAVIAHYVYLGQALAPARACGIYGVIDTIDVFHRRLPYYRTQRELPDWFPVDAATEARLLRLADRLIAIQPREAETLAAMTDPARVLVVEHGAVAARDLAERADDPAAVVLVASDNPFNVQGLAWFLAEVWPRVLAARPRALLHLYGNVARTCPAGAPRVRAHGFVAELGPAYRRARIAINPVRFGTGLKIKTVEAMAHGRAVVATAMGAEGLEDAAGRALLVADSPDDFAAAVAGLLEAPAKARSLGMAAWEYAQERFAPRQVYAPLLADLAGRKATWNYQQAHAAPTEALGRPAPPSPPLREPWDRAWQALSAGQGAEDAGAVRDAVAAAGGIDVELWTAASQTDDAALQGLALGPVLKDLGFRLAVRVPAGHGAVRGACHRAGFRVLTLDPDRPRPARPGTLVHVLSGHLLDNFALQGTLALRYAPWMTTCHLAGLEDSPPPFREDLWELATRWRGARRVCFVSEYQRRRADLLVGLRDVRHCTIGGVAPAPGDAAEEAGELADESGAFTWLWAARLAPPARPDLLLRGVRQALDLGLERCVRVWVAGAGPLEGQVRDDVRRLDLEGTVRLLGPRPDVAGLCAAADGFLLTGQAEGPPLDLLRALAAGKPVVAAAGGDVPHVVRHRREGLLFAPGDVAALAHGIREVVNHPGWAARLGRAAAALVPEVPTLEAAALRYALVYLDALGL